MKKRIIPVFITYIILLCSFEVFASREFNPSVKWITNMNSQSATNTWLAFRKTIHIDVVPEQAIAKIATDSKYWLWVNGRQVVFEGGLKRGPNPWDTYYDELDIASYLKQGSNTIAIQVWYFGKDGFSHKSSGRAGLLFDCDAGPTAIVSDRTWKSTVLRAYKTAEAPMANFRLPESSLLFDARESLGKWWDTDYDDGKMTASMEIGAAGDYPWNDLRKRPIPLWKDYGLKSYINTLSFPFVSTGDTIVCDLPYDAQITPYFEVEAEEGERIKMFTDNYLVYNGGDTGIRGEYITKQGRQEYENLGWLNGHKMYYCIPKGVKVLDLKFRETGYDTEFVGYFHSSDIFLNKFWNKAVRSVYVNMRDTYMDCPERERAQWSGDQVHEAAQAFYMFDSNAHALARKYLYETIAWQKRNGVLFGPVPAGNWDKELPVHMLSSIGYYGVWNYYMHTGDVQTLKNTYSGIKKYLALWEHDVQGTVKMRSGDWTWGDWGQEKDMLLIQNLWYYLAMKSLYNTAALIGEGQDAVAFKEFLVVFEQSFNRQFWTPSGYRSPNYRGKTDDRVQALAVVAEIVSSDKYPIIAETLKTEWHCSPFMEKFVLEALFKMGYGGEGLDRFKKRFDYMVNHPYFTTLFEGWGIGPEGFGGGSINHGWAGAGTVVLMRDLLGIKPIQPRFKVFQVLPALYDMQDASAKVPTDWGSVEVAAKQDDENFTLQVSLPEGTTAIAGVPKAGYRRVFLGNELIWENGKSIANKRATYIDEDDTGHIKFQITHKGSRAFVLKAIK
ncbi:glycoside hydrolase [Sphingobacterium sp. SGG-5]|uniref:alpha-L-rhamnosidase-related protein n=1 Tax=Sphingobacterium sp. SGG-5 TaxID=2710881 RepID=UPI0013EC84F6|nr:alpha-L-rhamnosidase C-terminal domain-containing protein [Sphingobacterium sp. SGG-5]NGM60924.1 glycoside hydrolase [Sphingobacterium sp. SGG-5]